jgi:hypothetical protein
MAITLEPNDRAKLRELLEQRYSLDELETLAFDLGVDYNQLPHSTTTQLSRELVSYFERRGNLSSLTIKMLGQRYDPFLTNLSTKLSPGSPRKKVQIIVAQDVDYNVNEIIADVATKLKIDIDQVELIGATWGSLHMLLGLPEEAANALINSQVHDLVSGKYRVISIRTFDSLDVASQEAWRSIVRESSTQSIPWDTVRKVDDGGSLFEQSRSGALTKHSSIVRQSGGVDLDATTITVGQDVVGRDKVVSAGGHIIHAETGATVIINEHTKQGTAQESSNQGQRLPDTGDVMRWAVWVVIGIVCAALAVIVSGLVWNFTNLLLKWQFYLGGSGNEPYGIAAFVWGSIQAFVVSSFAFIVGSVYWHIRRAQPSLHEILVVIILYTIFGGIGAWLFYNLGIRLWVESFKYGYGSQEIIIALVWSFVISFMTFVPIWFLDRRRRINVLNTRRLGLQIPFSVLLVFLAVLLSLIIGRSTAEVSLVRGFFAGVALKLGLFLGLLVSITQELRPRSLLQSLWVIVRKL